MKLSKLSWGLFILSSLVCLNTPWASEWSGWRGPGGQGISEEKGLPTLWDAHGNVAWVAKPPGKGASSPIVWKDLVFLTSQTEDTALHVLAFHRNSSGPLWDQEIGKGKLKSHNLHNMATPTPVCDGRNLWALFGTGDLACLDLRGKIVWHRNLVNDFGDYKLGHGYGSSPVLLNGVLYIALMHQGPSYLLALEASTGRTLWKTDRNLGPTDEARDSYSSPMVSSVSGRSEILLQGAEAVTAHDPETGALLWWFGGMRVPHPYGRTIAGVTAGENVVVAVASGFQNRGYTVAIKPGGHGDVTSSHKLWSQAKYSPDCPSPLIYNGYVYLIRDDGIASCLDLKTGEVAWQERLAENVKISPVAGDGHVYFTSGNANTTVVKAGPKFEIVAVNDVNEPTLSTPALAHGRVFLRTDKHLFSFEISTNPLLRIHPPLQKTSPNAGE